jgi:hypothetical protein
MNFILDYSLINFQTNLVRLHSYEPDTQFSMPRSVTELNKLRKGDNVR